MSTRKLHYIYKTTVIANCFIPVDYYHNNMDIDNEFINEIMYL